jgi:hypothetical protein
VEVLFRLSFLKVSNWEQRVITAQAISVLFDTGFSKSATNEEGRDESFDATEIGESSSISEKLFKPVKSDDLNPRKSFTGHSFLKLFNKDQEPITTKSNLDVKQEAIRKPEAIHQLIINVYCDKSCDIQDALTHNQPSYPSEVSKQKSTSRLVPFDLKDDESGSSKANSSNKMDIKNEEKSECANTKTNSINLLQKIFKQTQESEVNNDPPLIQQSKCFLPDTKICPPTQSSFDFQSFFTCHSKSEEAQEHKTNANSPPNQSEYIYSNSSIYLLSKQVLRS